MFIIVLFVMLIFGLDELWSFYRLYLDIFYKYKFVKKMWTLKAPTVTSSSSLLANSRVEHCHTNDLMPNVPIPCRPPSRVTIVFAP